MFKQSVGLIEFEKGGQVEVQDVRTRNLLSY